MEGNKITEKKNKTEIKWKGNRQSAIERKDRNIMEKNKNGQTDSIEWKEVWVWKDIWNGSRKQCQKCEQVCWQVTKRFLHQYLHIQTT